MTRRIAILNHKGGSGKTTTAVNLAATLAERKRQVLVVDLDSSANATTWLGCKDGATALYDILTSDFPVQRAIIPTHTHGVSLIPSSHTKLDRVERIVADEVSPNSILQARLARLDRSWDYVFFDCPPRLNTLTLNALVASTELFIPVLPGAMEVKGFDKILATLKGVHESRLNSDLRLSGILLCRHNDRTRLGRDVHSQLRASYGGVVFNTIIRENIRLAEAFGHSETILTYAPDCAGATDYRALAQEVLTRPGGSS